jgi:hypothetical protein
MIIRDFYFAAWLIDHGYSYSIESGRINFLITKSEFNELNRTYKNSDTAKYCREVKNLIRLINE